ncbi:MAG: DNA-deoxyinosine glycosylase, partial [Alphaproteobacteria bacterium]|nr:DNA-deoxyinosine glycosylase [Alphaproteobacteria bacterium]
MQKKCLEPWINDKTRILIVGTMPGEKSLHDKTYYANSQNRFWKYISEILNNGVELKSIEDKKAILYSHGIGLWDALSKCERDGSLDSKIKNYKPNDFSKFQTVKYILFNGQKAAKYFEKYNLEYLSKRQSFSLPSTSPANA